MNYSMQGMTKNNSQALRDAEIDEGRNQEKHQVLMVNETTSFKKRAKGRRGTSRRTASELLLKVKKLKYGPKPETKCFYCKGTSHWKRNYPSIWWIRRMAK